jgi:hypothetical protein
MGIFQSKFLHNVLMQEEDDYVLLSKEQSSHDYFYFYYHNRVEDSDVLDDRFPPGNIFQNLAVPFLPPTSTTPTGRNTKLVLVGRRHCVRRRSAPNSRVFQDWRQFYIQKIQQVQMQPKTIVRLHLSNIRLCREIVQALETLFECDDRVWLSVSFHRVDGWSRVLPSLKRVRALAIYGSPFTLKEMEALARDLPPRLESLSLEGIPAYWNQQHWSNTRRAQERAVQALMLGLESIRRTLTQLRLSNCGVYSHLILMDGVSSLSKLECLEFYGASPVFPGQMPQLLHALTTTTTTNPRLLRLVLAGVPMGSTRVIHSLAGWFSDPSCYLQEFHGIPPLFTRWDVLPVPPADAMFLGARQLFLEALHSNTSLKKLDISFLSIDNLHDLSRLATIIQSKKSQWTFLILKLDIGIHSVHVEGVDANANAQEDENTVRLSFLQAVQQSSLERIYIQGSSCSKPGIWKDWFRQLQWITHLHWAGEQRLFQAQDHHSLISAGATTTKETIASTISTKIQVALWPLVLVRIRQRADPRFHSTTNAASVLYHFLRNGPILMEQR